MTQRASEPDQATFGSYVLLGIVGGVIGGALSLALWLIAGLVGMPKLVQVPGAGLAELEWFNFIAIGFMTGIAAGIIAGFLRSRTSAGRTFSIIALVVLVLSCLGPLFQPADVAWSTRIVLIVTHVIVYLTVVPAQVRKLP